MAEETKMTEKMTDLAELRERIARAIQPDVIIGTSVAISDAALSALRDFLAEKGLRIVPALSNEENRAELTMLLAGKNALYSCSEDPEIDDARKCFVAMLDAAPDLLKE